MWVWFWARIWREGAWPRGRRLLSPKRKPKQNVNATDPPPRLLQCTLPGPVSSKPFVANFVRRFGRIVWAGQGGVERTGGRALRGRNAYAPPCPAHILPKQRKKN